MKVITDPKNVIPDIKESDIDNKAVITVVSKYAWMSGITFLGIAMKESSEYVYWAGTSYKRDNILMSSTKLSDWLAGHQIRSLLNLMIYDRNEYSNDVYFLVIENGDDYIQFQKMFPGVNENLLIEIRKKLATR